MQFYTQQEGQFRQIFKVPKLEWCKLMKGGKSGTLFLMKFIIQIIRDRNPEVFHECPYEGVVGVENFPISRQIGSILPVGLFRANTSIIDETSKAVITFTILLDVFN